MALQHITTHLNPVIRQPIVTGTSVLAIKYKDGIMMAADNLASYGSLARFKDIERLYAVGNNTVIGAGGDMSDFQYLKNQLEELVIDELTAQDGHSLGPPRSTSTSRRSCTPAVRG
jgi:20S proteasome subunit beta 7